MTLEKENLKKIFEKVLKKDIVKIEELKFEDKEGITGKVEQSSVNLHKYGIVCKDGLSKEVLVKSKSRNIIKNGIKLLNHDNDMYLLYLLIRYHKVLSFDKNYIRELKFYENIDIELKKYTIPCYGCYKNSLQSKYFIFMKEIKDSFEFDKSYIYKTLDVIIKFHKQYYGKKECCNIYRLNYYTNHDYKRSRKLLSYIFHKFDKENKVYFSSKGLEKIEDFLVNIHIYHKKLPKHLSLTHNDFTARNIFFRKEAVLIYDWELACYQNPEHDLIEFLIFELHKFADNEVRELIAYYKNNLLSALNINIQKADYERILEFNTLEYIVNKLSVYRLADVSLKFDFMSRVCKNASRVLLIVEDIF
mgnify:FL=1